MCVGIGGNHTTPLPLLEMNQEIPECLGNMSISRNGIFRRHKDYILNPNAAGGGGDYLFSLSPISKNVYYMNNKSREHKTKYSHCQGLLISKELLKKIHNREEVGPLPVYISRVSYPKEIYLNISLGKYNGRIINTLDLKKLCAY